MFGEGVSPSWAVSWLRIDAGAGDGGKKCFISGAGRPLPLAPLPGPRPKSILQRSPPSPPPFEGKGSTQQVREASSLVAPRCQN